jgi:kynurenine formamidase
MTTIIDLTHPVRESMPVLPGDPPPEIRDALTLQRDGCSVQSIRFSNHLGTHMDAPSHFVPDGASIERIPPQVLVGPAAVLDFTDKGRGACICMEELQSRMPASPLPERLLLKTGWDAHFETGGYFDGFPVLTRRGAQYLASLDIGLLGMDTPSPSPFDDPGQAIHRVLLGSGLVLLESAANLTALPAVRFELIALPLALAGCSGSPCRALAVVGTGA